MKLLNVIIEDYQAAECAEDMHITERQAAVSYLVGMNDYGDTGTTEGDKPTFADFIVKIGNLNIYHDFGAGYYFAEVIA